MGNLGTQRLSRDERRERVLDTAGALFYARGPHEVGMDELINATGLGKATVYRLYSSKDQLIGAYLDRLATTILAAIDADVVACSDPATALHRVLDAIAVDLQRAEFRGCPFNNASIEYPDPRHPAREVARRYRAELADRLIQLSEQVMGERNAGAALGSQLAVLIDGAYTNAAHLGFEGPAAAGLDLAHHLVRQGRGAS